MVRLFNIAISLILIMLFVIPALIVFLVIRLTSVGPAIYWSKRVGRENKIFLMPKFRTMKINTPQVATHLLSDGHSHMTPVGALLRKSSLDELPQVWSVFVGDMNIVGPRPALFNQDDLIELRTKQNVHLLTPGITGWAQVNGRDELSIPIKVQFDKEYLDRRSLFFDIKIIFLTAYRVINRSNISH
jgi:O-antigen biosynthesis protein WbqP